MNRQGANAASSTPFLQSWFERGILGARFRFQLGALLLFVLTSLLYVIALHLWNRDRIDHFVAHLSHDIEHTYQLIYLQQKELAEAIFEASINQPRVLDLVRQAARDPAQRDRSRQALLQGLHREYRFFYERGLRQLHFHLPDNESLLRFHRPEKFGDNLTGYRSTVEWVNRRHEPIDGFEEGRIYNGFRFVFPLQDAEGGKPPEHLGSVEISFNVLPFLDELALHKGEAADLLIRSDVVAAKVTREEQPNYRPSPFPGYAFQREIQDYLSAHARHLDPDILTPDDRQHLVDRLAEGQIFSLVGRDKRSLMTAIPLRNPVSREVVAALLVQVQSPILAGIYQSEWLALPSGLLVMLIAAFVFYRERRNQLDIRQLLRRTQRILDTQDSIIVITDTLNIVDCNRAFLDFFGVERLEEFKESFRCVCHRFETDDKFFHLGKVPAGENWVRYLAGMPKREQIVSMLDRRGEPHAFTLSVSAVDDYFLLDFLDISDTMLAHFELEERAVHDRLTGAFNREHLARVTGAPSGPDGILCPSRGILMFDIDHFKQINDTWGHARGDLVLVHLAHLVQAMIRREDMLVRWGGEEFIVLAQSDNLEHLRQLAEKIRATIEATPFDEVRRVTVSIGVGLCRVEEPFDAALKRVDQALYRAKESGRNRVEAAA